MPGVQCSVKVFFHPLRQFNHDYPSGGGAHPSIPFSKSGANKKREGWPRRSGLEDLVEGKMQQEERVPWQVHLDLLQWKRQAPAPVHLGMLLDWLWCYL